MKNSAPRLLRLAASLFGLVSIFLPFVNSLAANRTPANEAQKLDLQDFADLEQVVLTSFNRNRCSKLDALVQPTQWELVTPVTLAVIAYCEPRVELSEKLYSLAEKKEPKNESIAYLHAHTRWKKDPKASLPYWERLQLVATDRVLKALSKEYLEGPDEEPEFYPIKPKWNYYGSLSAGAGYETNPRLETDATFSAEKSALLNLAGNIGVQDKLSFGYLAGNYSLLYDYYRYNLAANFFHQELDLPVVIETGSHSHLRVRPYGVLNYQGESIYYYAGGLAIAGINYHQGYKQRCAALFYKDSYRDFSFVRHLKEQGGDHYRFEYQWELSSLPWSWNILTFIEHVKAGTERTPAIKLTVPFSHNAVGMESTVQYNFQWGILGLNSLFALREDDQDSRYLSIGASPVAMTERREDVKFGAGFFAIFPLAHELQLIADYRWMKNISNIGETDYRDYGYQNHRVLLSIKAFISPL